MSKRALLWATCSCLLWFALNVVLQFMNKQLFTYSHFAYPLFVMLVNLGGCFLLSALLIFGAGVEEYPLQEVRSQWKLVLVLAVCSGLSAGCQGMSVSLVSISLNQTIKSTAPIFNIVVSYLWLGRPSSLERVFSSLMMLCGVFLAVFDNSESNHIMGFVYAMLSVSLSSVATVIADKVLKTIQPLSLLLSTSSLSFMAIFPWFLLTEFHAFHRESLHKHRADFFESLFIALCSFLYVLASNYVIKTTSAVYYAILGTMKVVGLIIISLIVFPTPLSPINPAGLVLSSYAFILYNYFAYSESKEAKEGQVVSVALKAEEDHEV